MKRFGENSLFVINILLIAGLIGVGFWIQQNNTIVTPAASGTLNAQIVKSASDSAAGAVPITVSTATGAGQHVPVTSPSSLLASPAKATTTPPIIRRSHENESGERYIDE